PGQLQIAGRDREHVALLEPRVAHLDPAVGKLNFPEPFGPGFGPEITQADQPRVAGEIEWLRERRMPRRGGRGPERGGHIDRRIVPDRAGREPAMDPPLLGGEQAIRLAGAAPALVE